MGSVTIEREKAPWRDRARAYTLKIDGVSVGSVKSGETLMVPLQPGTHRVHLTIDWCRSPEFQVDGSADHRFRCKAGGNSLMALFDLIFRSNEYISLDKV